MNLWESIKSIPLLLRISALASLVLGVMLPVSVFVPGSSFNLAGTLLSHEQVWSSGVAVAIFSSAPLMFAVGLGILLRRRWVRWLLVALPILQFLPFQVAHWYFGAPNPAPSFQDYIAYCSAWAAAAFAYLALWAPAKQFFGEVRA